MIEKFKTRYDRVEKGFLIFIMSFMGFNMFAQVVLRYAFHYPLPFGEELSRYLQIWLMFFGLVFGLRTNTHIRMSLLYDRFPPRLRAFIDFFLDVCVLSALFLVFPGSVDYFVNQLPMSWLGISWMSMGVTAFAIPATFAMLIVYFIIRCIFFVAGLFRTIPKAAE